MTASTRHVIVTLCVVLAIAVSQSSAQGTGGGVLVGTGSYDVTGVPIGLGFMGYAQPSQIGSGLHFRQRARAFVVASASDPSKRWCYVSSDNAFITQAIFLNVIKSLATKFGGVYTAENTMLSGTHTHSTPGGMSFFTLYDVTTYGVSEQSIDAYVNGIVAAIGIAHNNLKPGAITKNRGKLYDSNINRSAPAYLLNPQAERDAYPDGNTDKDITTLRFDQGTTPVGMVCIFSVHGTSMNLTNTLVSGDNKGLASYLFEKDMNDNSTAPGNGTFVAAFGQTNEGDVSPNTGGAKCPDGSPCAEDSTCNGKEETCVGRGPGKDMFDSTWIIGSKQYDAAKGLYNAQNGTAVTGDVDFRFSWVDMTSVTIEPQFHQNISNENAKCAPPKTRTTCKPAYGMSFAAGTTDGRGDFDFKQGTTIDNASPWWKIIRDLLKDPSEEQKACHCPKPILVDSGEMDVPWAWTPRIMPIQLFRVGDVWLIGAPGEFTTMAGRRLRASVQKAVTDAGQWTANSQVLIAGLTNTYIGYITTLEEYQMQRYEAASTAFGPHTLEAYQQEFAKLATAMATGQSVPVGTAPPNLSDKYPKIPPEFGGEWVTNLLRDKAPYDETTANSAFGTCIKQPSQDETAGTVVSAEFVAGDLRRDLMTQNSWLFVDVKGSDGTWKPFLTDSDWATKLHWRRVKPRAAIATVEWETQDHTYGTFRIRHQGYALPKDAKKNEFYSGMTNEFRVLPPAEVGMVASIKQSLRQPGSTTGQAFWIGIVIGAVMCAVTWQVVTQTYRRIAKRRGRVSSREYELTPSSA